MPVEVGKVVDGTVLNITSFGAFVQLPEGETGLVHISEVADKYVKDVRDYLKEKDKVKVKILSVSPDGKISLSIKKANAELKKSSRPLDLEWNRNKSSSNMSFEDRLAKFLKDSDERQQQLKKNLDTRRRSGGGYNRGKTNKMIEK
ncbi:S1 RNA binding domain protein [Caldanaerobius fijiensis DSM 17918]|uniref:S1 RNA binding domain protein n=1 Tax=Caldanaerobius fijiensis DSM 17918 TaxID=1121256 RepID=A0A1M4W816_9THEO|nr:S1 domain-containing RNA-binding protein [Caldanaerobius fijiensis]SHE77122.1 S1 RNA binding domain protein [Caldanaerobius fijiensis DSM 17918]